MNRRRLMIGWTILMVVLAGGGCGPASVPADEEPAFGPALARDAAMANLWAEGEPMPALDWSEEDLTHRGLVGSSTMRYTAGEWVVTVTYPIVAPDATVYQVNIINTTSGLTWNGEVDAQGNVSEVAGGSADMPNPASIYCEEQGGRLEIRTGGDGGQYGVCIFADGSECEEWAFFRGECGPGGLPPSEVPPPTAVLDQEAAYEGVRFFYAQAIAAGATGETVDAEETMGGEVIPEHVLFSFGSYALPGTFHEPRIHIYPVSAFAADGMAAKTVASLRSLLDSGQLPAPSGGFAGATIPFLPPFNAGQLLHTQTALLDFQNGRGVRFLTEYAQYYAPINNTDLFYTFQGLTDDGQFYVAAILPVAHPSLPADASQIPDDDPEAFANTYDTYANDIALQLAAYDPSEFTPALALLDALIASLEVTP
jgi:putative hemolysin